MIGFLETALDRIKRNRQRYLWLQEEISILRLIVECGTDDGNVDSVSLDDKVAQMEAVEREIEKAKAAIAETGCILKDEEKGMIDFFSIQNNTVVYLSWHKKEENVQFWRSIRETDATVRRPLTGSPRT